MKTIIENGAPVFLLKACSMGQMAAAYGVSIRVLRKWLQPYIKEIGKQKGSSLTLEQVVLIVEKIGLPVSEIVVNDKLSASGCEKTESLLRKH